jgi:ribosomal protein L37E
MLADQWPDDGRLSDLEDKSTCTACGQRGADVRSDFNWHLKKAEA